MKTPILIYGDLWMFLPTFVYFPNAFLVCFPPYQRFQYQKMMMINELPNWLPLVWALVARLVSNGCSSLVHHLPIT